MVMRLDLRDFFATVGRRRIMALFLTVGYPEAVAALLAGLCTHGCGKELFEELDLSPLKRRRRESLYSRPHLPQGAPTSPALANLAAHRLDCRLSALAASAGAHYTRYADDLAFSGERAFARSARRFHLAVAAIACEEGFAINPRKTRLMRAATRQRLAGIIVNEHPNLDRREYDRLKAMLHNCVVYGPVEQNRDGHADFRAYLAGKVSYAAMIHPARAQRLRDMFQRIVWPEPTCPAGAR